MGRGCNLDLCLLPAGIEANPPSPDSIVSRLEDSTGNEQKLTIFYNGRVSVCDVTELQARAILHLARREIDERKKPIGTESLSRCQPQVPPLSMKRSLQRFLQKRKNRIQATSPYLH
ncbi:hypothetical protein AAC387_Pa07g3397 [Persea americana]|eukprot:TRINITY_DN10290_c0_g1_i4.p1 TRINITY_DN10290_c0_g1~~TRINITY_DN10290_c0_g1_i4.p1  ORF type:complete len:117 (+),score=17.30 TRINITY_DN10290_c0_g1_i4:143-493(+)